MPDQTRNYASLLTHMEEEYADYSPESRLLNQAARQVMIDGGSHGRRLNRPFPPRIRKSSGAWLHDEDGHILLDFWQGHFANLLGHNPPFLSASLAEAFQSGFGLQSGFTDRLQIEAAEMFCRQVGAEKVRFTTSGTLGTMYSIMLSRAFTGRSLVLKISGGFHGAQPWGLKGVSYHAGQSGYNHPEGEGVPGDLMDEILLTPFNDAGLLAEQFKRHGDRIACLIMEPVLGAGGFITASLEFMQAARQLTEQYGAILILDEVISGFRFRAGDLAGLYGVRPDLAIFGKVMGGGMPVAAVAGRTDLLNLAGHAGHHRVHFNGGTYSAHPATMLATRLMIQHLVKHEEEIYARLAVYGQRMRDAMVAAFTGVDIPAVSTGALPPEIGGSSLGAVHFPYDPQTAITSPGIASDPAKCDVLLRTEVLPLALLLQDTHIITSHGCWTAAHGDAELSFFNEALQKTARRIKKSL